MIVVERHFVYTIAIPEDVALALHDLLGRQAAGGPTAQLFGALHDVVRDPDD